MNNLPVKVIARVANEGLRPPVPRSCPWAHIMQACWHEDPAARPTFSQVPPLHKPPPFDDTKKTRAIAMELPPPTLTRSFVFFLYDVFFLLRILTM
jgi:hypothetical protein